MTRPCSSVVDGLVEAIKSYAEEHVSELREAYGSAVSTSSMPSHSVDDDDDDWGKKSKGKKGKGKQAKKSSKKQSSGTEDVNVPVEKFLLPALDVYVRKLETDGVDGVEDIKEELGKIVSGEAEQIFR